MSPASEKILNFRFCHSETESLNHLPKLNSYNYCRSNDLAVENNYRKKNNTNSKEMTKLGNCINVMKSPKNVCFMNKIIFSYQYQCLKLVIICFKQIKTMQCFCRSSTLPCSCVQVCLFVFDIHFEKANEFCFDYYYLALAAF